MTSENMTSDFHRLLIVDDSKFNRDLLTDILGDEYLILEAENGKDALEIMTKMKNDISCILLDLSMQLVNGFEVLETMNKHHWLKTLPVIIISAEDSPAYIKKAYELGASDFINRPFDSDVVKRRVKNTVNLYMNQKKLTSMVVNQFYENERNSNIMIAILGHIVEFRNKESSAHISKVSMITRLLLEKMVNKKICKISKNDISLIVRAAALHDVGKISIPTEILNKPGKLTDEEFEIMKSHSLVGAKMLESIKEYQNEKLVKTAYRICRWHHERWDGKGYPDRLEGSKIPLEAQVVSIADVYDALTSERCYKKAYSHDTALKMILNNECGVFNPVLCRCLVEIAPLLLNVSSKDREEFFNNSLDRIYN